MFDSITIYLSNKSPSRSTLDFSIKSCISENLIFNLVPNSKSNYYLKSFNLSSSCSCSYNSVTPPPPILKPAIEASF